MILKENASVIKAIALDIESGAITITVEDDSNLQRFLDHHGYYRKISMEDAYFIEYVLGNVFSNNEPVDATYFEKIEDIWCPTCHSIYRETNICADSWHTVEGMTNDISDKV